jgi:hypothetical protein
VSKHPCRGAGRIDHHGSIAIEQSKTELPAVAAPKAESPTAASCQALQKSSGSPLQASPTNVPTNQPLPDLRKRTQSLPDPREIPVRASPMPVQPSSSPAVAATYGEPKSGRQDQPPPGSNGLTELPEDSDEGQEAQWAPALTGSPRHSGTAVPAGLTKPLWTDEEVDKLRALYPTHSASAIAEQMGRGRNSIRSKAQNLGLKKDGPPTVTSKPAKPAPKPRSLSAAVTADLAIRSGYHPDAGDITPAGEISPGGDPTTGRNSPAELPEDSVKGQEAHGFSAVSLLDHHLGQCRWIISDVWPVMYCGAPVVDSSSWCEEHSRRVFDGERQRRAATASRTSQTRSSAT